MVNTKKLSLSSRRAWIEIYFKSFCVPILLVVALLTESVDWNGCQSTAWYLSYCRSPHGERGLKSPWLHHHKLNQKVALLTESVDWNYISHLIKLLQVLSLSSRRAWIEIEGKELIDIPLELSRSPHGERGLKFNKKANRSTHISRSPHGERGLKSCDN